MTIVFAFLDLTSGTVLVLVASVVPRWSIFIRALQQD